MRFTLFFTFLSIVGAWCPVQAQAEWQLSGCVTDSSYQPLAAASVYATTADSLKNIIGFGSSDAKGNFRLNIALPTTQVLLHVSYLGYEPHEMLMTPLDTSCQKMLIRLSAQKYSLPEIVVSAQQPELVQRGDTTTYNLRYFRDSTEFSVEDVLKKLPGVVVKSNGEILVNGKAIDKVLVEGSDMFGRQYTLGTKNIRAAFIDQVQIIDRYQENPMLKNIVASDAMVLNLKMSDAQKNIVSGSFNLGSGYGEREWKLALNSNIFFISQKTKVIVLAAANNVGQDQGVKELAATYGGTFEKNDLKAELQRNPDFLSLPQIQTLRDLPPPNTDNSRQAVVTLRAEQKLTKNWVLNWNTTLAHSSDAQNTAFGQRFAFDSSYNLDVARKLQLQNQQWESAIFLQKFNADQSQNFQIYGHFGTTIFGSYQNITRQASGKATELSSRAAYQNPKGLAGASFTQKINNSSLFQCQIKFQKNRQNELLTTKNNDFSIFFLQDSTFVTLQQPIKYDVSRAEALLKYNTAHQNWQLELSTKNSYNSLYANVEKKLFSPTFSTILPTFSDVSVGYRSQANARASYSMSPSWVGSVEAQADFSTVRTNLKHYEFQTLSPKITLQKRWTASQELNFGWAWINAPPADYELLETNYFSDNFTYWAQNRRDAARQLQKIFCTYRQQNILQSSSFSLFTSYQLFRAAWTEEIDFYQSVQTLRPFLAHHNDDFYARGSVEKFISYPLRMKVYFQASYGQSSRQAAVASSPNTFVSQRIQTQTALRLFLFRTDAQLQLEHDFDKQFHFANASAAQITTYHHLQATLLYKWQKWQFSYVSHVFLFQNNATAAAYLTSNHFKIATNITFGGRTSNLALEVYNLENKRRYGSVQTDGLFIFTNTVAAVPSFFILKFDWNI